MGRWRESEPETREDRSPVCPPNYALHRAGPERPRGRAAVPSHTAVRLHVQCPCSDQEATCPLNSGCALARHCEKNPGDWGSRAQPPRGPPHTSNRGPSVRRRSRTSQAAAPLRDTWAFAPALLAGYWVSLRTALSLDVFLQSQFSKLHFS